MRRALTATAFVLLNAALAATIPIERELKHREQQFQQFATDMERSIRRTPRTIDTYFQELNSMLPLAQNQQDYVDELTVVLHYTTTATTLCQHNERISGSQHLQHLAFLYRERARLRYWNYTPSNEFYLRSAVDATISNLEMHMKLQHSSE